MLPNLQASPETAEFSKTRIDEISPQFSDEFVEATWQLENAIAGRPVGPGIAPRRMFPTLAGENEYKICVAVPGVCDAGESYLGPDACCRED